MIVDSVQLRTRDAFLIFAHHHVQTGARFDRVAVIPAWAGVHSTYQLEIGWEGQRALSVADGDRFIFQRLAQHFQHAHPEFR